MTTVLFTGGGTGGHLMPALAIAEQMTRLDPTIRPFFIGARRGLEASVLPHRPWPYELLPLEPIWRRRWWRNARLPFALLASLRAIRRILGEHKPALVVGTGGYVAGPVVWAAMNRGVPAVLLEVNAYPGIATRWLSKRARQVHLGFPEARQRLRFGPHTEVFDSGNPIPPPPSPKPAKSDAKQKLGFAPERPLVFVTGGSQGALAINLAVAGALEAGKLPGDASLLWQCGQGSFERFARFRETVRVEVEAFIDPVSDAYAAADLVVARSGGTVASLAAWGLPAILIPLPSAAAGHQLSNARAAAEAGAAIVLEQSKLTPQSLAETVNSLLKDPAGMAHLAVGAARRARPNAATEIATRALQIVENS